MQNRYVGDLGDFGKYGLLRSLSSDLRLGIVWYLVPDEGHNADGKFIDYLVPKEANCRRFRSCDPVLFDTLATIVAGNERSVGSVRLSGLLPSDTRYFEEPLSYEGFSSIGPSAKAQRLLHRKRWVERATRAMEQADIVFVDPDNGIARATERHQKLGPKYVYVDEITPYLDRDQSVVIYQHIHRIGSATEQVRQQLAMLSTVATSDQPVYAVIYRRGTARAFFIIAAPDQGSRIGQKIGNFVEGPWSQHFELVPSRP